MKSGTRGRKSRVITRRAIKIAQNERHPLFVLSLTGDEILAISDISRLSRDDAGKLIGYQRPEVRKHVQDITDYLNSSDILFPNSIILAVSSAVKFHASRGRRDKNASVSVGTLEIPTRRNGHRPAWIVDGQQRVLAISKSKRRDFPIPVNAFIADEVELQRDQFLRVNNTRPLPRGLITELLPEISTPLPAKLSPRKIPSAICDVLNSDPKSPFYQLISRASTPTECKKVAVVADTSIIKMIEDSLSSPSGCLFAYRNIATGETDFDGIWWTLVAFWSGVKKCFPDAWGKPPAKSRLMHGAGIRAMGRLMDRIMSSIQLNGHNPIVDVQHELRTLVPVCRWTQGRWRDMEDIAWNEVQNVPRHIRMLSNFLIRTYVHQRGAHK
jgi:DGQHR domain-containing protein